MDINTVGSKASGVGVGGGGRELGSGRDKGDKNNGHRYTSRMTELRGVVSKIYQTSKVARTNGLFLPDLKHRVQSRVPWPVRSDYLLMGILTSHQPYMFDAELQRVYRIDERG